MEIYIPRSLGIVDEDIPYLDWMETLIRDLLTAKPMDVCLFVDTNLLEGVFLQFSINNIQI